MDIDWLPLPEQPDLAALLPQTVLSVLPDLGLLAIEGPDAARFLQGQLTCHVQEITATTSRTGAHCTPKGRMIANFRLLQRAEQALLCCVPGETRAALQQSLGKYIVFSKATLRDASADYLAVGVSGPEAAARVSTALGTAPDTLHAVAHGAQGSLVIRVAEPARFLCLLPAASARELCAALQQGTSLSDARYWHWLDIRDGLGEVRRQTVEAFTPQMLNLQLTGGISFTKGCYTGQEIVARTQYRGILKKAMYRIGGSGPLPQPDEALFQRGEEQPVGHVVMAETVTGSQWEALAVIPHEASEAALHTATQAAVTVLPLPYAIPVAPPA